MEMKLCQSCGMPLTSDEVLGTNADGSLNDEYCTYCYQHGKFTQNYTMDEMIEHCAQFTDEFNKGMNTNLTREEAIAGMKEFFPTLKRWQ
nr:zinc ribbon domain-containing protein [uncultured Bacteroides sp.]